MKKLISIFLSIGLAFTLSGFGASADTGDPVEAFLLSTGMPQEVIDQLPDGQKQVIFETLDNTATFAGCDVKNYHMTEDGEIVEIDDEQPTTRAGQLNITDIKLYVAAYEQVYNGIDTFAIFPSFEWSRAAKVNNDSFAMALYPNWEVVPGDVNFRLWIKNVVGEPVQYHDMSPDVANSSGFSYKIPSNVGAASGYYEGHTFLRAKKTTANATRAISLRYVHDTSSLFSVSYTITIGPFSINIEGNSDNLSTIAGNYAF